MMYNDLDELNEGFINFCNEFGIPLKRNQYGHIEDQNRQTCDTRMVYCDFVESAYRNGECSEKLADKAWFYEPEGYEYE